MICKCEGALIIAWQSHYFALGFLLSHQLAKSPSSPSSSLISDALASYFLEENRSYQKEISANYLQVYLPTYSHRYLLCSFKANLHTVSHLFHLLKNIAPANLLSLNIISFFALYRTIAIHIEHAAIKNISKNYLFHFFLWLPTRFTACKSSPS